MNMNFENVKTALVFYFISFDYSVFILKGYFSRETPPSHRFCKQLVCVYVCTKGREEKEKETIFAYFWQLTFACVCFYREHLCGVLRRGFATHRTFIL